jgi:hypothetical protein
MKYNKDIEDMLWSSGKSKKDSRVRGRVLKKPHCGDHSFGVPQMVWGGGRGPSLGGRGGSLRTIGLQNPAS